MSYGNYAPFYRGGYFNPMQTPIMPNMADGQNQFTQPYQAPIQTPNQPMQNMQQPIAQPVNDMLWVLNETEATSYPVAPNNSVTLWDKNQDTVYIKSVNMQGVPSMRILDYVERTAETPKTPEKHVCNCSKEFVPIATFNALVERIDVLSAKVDGMSATAKSKAKVKEETENG